MKVFPFKIPKPENSTLLYQEDVEEVFYDQLHQHDEIQVSYLKKGRGTLLVSDSLIRYSEGDIFLIGSNLPHAFKSDKNTHENSEMLSLFFTKNTFGSDFFSKNKFSELDALFLKIKQGIVVENKKEEINQQFNRLKNASKLERFIALLEILKTIASAKTRTLSNIVNQKVFSDNDGKRLRTVFDYTIKNASEKISLEDVACEANMTKNAFCKYFKKRTKKTYVEFLTEIRIENACKLLQQNTDLSIPQVAYSCGFHNISNFNRKFKKIKKTTPLHYRKRIS